MDRQEFLNTLRAQLSGEVSPGEAEDNIRYYDEYIREAIGNGKMETQVIDEIGSPFLIARTIIDTSEAAGNMYKSQGSGTSSYQQNQDSGQQDTRTPEGNFGSFNLSGKSKWVIIGILFLVVVVILSLLGSVIALISRFFIPILIVVLVLALAKGKGKR